MGKSKTANPMLPASEKPKKPRKSLFGKKPVSAEPSAPAMTTAESPNKTVGMAKPKVNPSVTLSGKARAMKAFCDAAPKVHISLPLEPGEPDNTVKDVWINGYHFPVPKGVMVEVPKPIFDILDRHYKFTARALSQGLITKQAPQSGVSAEEALL